SQPFIVTLSGVAPTISITAPPDTCAGIPLTFIAATTGEGATPQYVWKVNDTIKASGSTKAFTSSTLQTGDSVTCTLISSLACALPKTAIAQPEIITAKYIMPSIYLTISPDTVTCAGSIITLIAHSLNGGDAPSYQWELNGSPVDAD